MRKRPAELLFAYNEFPPPLTLFGLACQHAMLLLSGVIFPLVAAHEAGLSAADTQGLVTLSFIAAGFATLLQCTPWIGSGLLIVHIPHPVMLPAFLLAVKTGGLALAGMITAMSGLVQVAVSHLLPRLRMLFPPEVCGVAVVMMGVTMVDPGIRRFTGIMSGADGPDLRSLTVAAITLGIIVGLSVWSRKTLRLYSLLIGCAAGYAAALVDGVLPVSRVMEVFSGPVWALPAPHLPAGLPDAGLALLALLLGLVFTLITLGGIITADKMDNANWVRPDMKVVSRGCRAYGVGNLIAGLIGGNPLGLSASNIALGFATGATSRVIGIAAGALVMVAAFLPPVPSLLALMPAPVMGAILVYAAAYFIVNGMALTQSRMLNDRRIFTIGFSLFIGIGIAEVPHLFKDLPACLQPVLGSELPVAAVTAILLNLLFRVGVTRHAVLPLIIGGSSLEPIYNFMERQGASWGARRDVIQRATQALIETLEVLAANRSGDGAAVLEATFDEFCLELTLRYGGSPLAFDGGGPSSAEPSGSGEADWQSLSRRLICRYADSIRSDTTEGMALLALRFEH